MESQPNVEDLVFEYLEKVEDDPGRASQLLEDLCSAHPDHAQRLRNRIAVLRETGLWEEPVLPLVEPDQLGDYQLLRVLGTGGMGVVHLALQKSIGRKVALKRIRGEQLHDAGARARFVREVQAIARLDHPGIVQILAAGQDSGIPFLTMEYVVGASLERILAALRGRTPASLVPDDARAVLHGSIPPDELTDSGSGSERLWSVGWIPWVVRLVRDLANAVHHAHQRGVLHRDLKPSNVLLTPDGRVRLLDFGLATLGGDHSLTRTGTQLGSLPFMAPEQVAGRNEQIGPCSDQYSLGVILYELLTLELPFRGETHEAISRSILQGEPASPRRRLPSLSRDVETVCLKAMDRDPARRYATVAEFAADLEAILSLQPVRARPLSFGRRVVRFAQRRPARTVGVILGTLVLAAGPVGWELRRDRSLAEVRAAQQRSEADFQDALDAIGHVLRDMAWEDLEDVPRMQVARLKALDRARELFDRLASSRADDPRLARERVQLCRSRAEVLVDLGRFREADAELVSALALIDQGPAEVAADGVPRSASAYSQLGKVRVGLQQYDEALQCYEKAMDALRGVVNAADTFEHAQAWIVTLADRSEVLQLQGRWDPARKDLEDALTRVEELCDSHPDDPWSHWTEGRVLSDLARITSPDSLDSARAYAERSLRANERACELAPSSRYFLYDRACALLLLALVSQDSERWALADAYLDEGSALAASLQRDYPDAYRIRRLVGQFEAQRGYGLGKQSRHAEAYEPLTRAMVIYDELHRDLPDSRSLLGEMVQCLVNRAQAMIHRDQGDDREQALDVLDRATGICDVLHQQAISKVQADLERVLTYCRALDLVYLGDLEGSIESREELEEQAANGQSDAWTLRMIADLHCEELTYLAAHPEESGDDEDERAERQESVRDSVFEYLSRAVEAGYRDVREMATNPVLAPLRDDPRLAELMTRMGRSSS